MSREKAIAADPGRLAFPALGSHPLFHGVFNRFGGVSPRPWDSRNVSFGLGDRAENVQTNRRRIKEALGCHRLVSARQVHGSEVSIVRKKPEDDLEVDRCDGLVSNIPGVGLMVQQADCQAVLLFDPLKQVVGICHAGWRGTVADIIGRTLGAMHDAFDTDTADLIAAVSPSLGPCCAEFVNYRSELPVSLHAYQVRPGYFDFWAISRAQLKAAGVLPANIHIAGICTRCSAEYFSYRRERRTGRFAAVIGLRQERDGVVA